MTDACDRCGDAVDGVALYFELEYPAEDGLVASTALGLCGDCAGEIATEALEVRSP